jgi:cold-inducible RNA-binding protein
VALITDRDTGNSKGFAFVEMSNQAEAEKAISSLNGFSLDGRELKVNQAKPREDRNSRGPGTRGSGFENRNKRW